MVYYELYLPHNSFSIPIQETNSTDYLNSFLEKPATEIAHYFVPCIQMYDSKEYKQKIQEIIKKYCKDCKILPNKAFIKPIHTCEKLVKALQTHSNINFCRLTDSINLYTILDYL